MRIGKWEVGRPAHLALGLVRSGRKRDACSSNNYDESKKLGCAKVSAPTFYEHSPGFTQGLFASDNGGPIAKPGARSAAFRAA